MVLTYLAKLFETAGSIWSAKLERRHVETVCNHVRIASFRPCLNVKTFLSPLCAAEC
jgi:hypothetical protein